MLDPPDLETVNAGTWRADLFVVPDPSDRGLDAVASKSAFPREEGDDGSHGSAEERREASEFNTFIHGVGSSPIDAMASVLRFFDVDSIYDLIEAPSYTPRGPCDERFDPQTITSITAVGNCDSLLPAINHRMAGADCPPPLLNCDPCTEGIDVSNPFDLPDADLDCLRSSCEELMAVAPGQSSVQFPFPGGDDTWQGLPNEDDRAAWRDLFSHAWDLLQANDDIVQWVACLIGGNTRQRCVERRLRRGISIEFESFPPPDTPGAFESVMRVVDERNYHVWVNLDSQLTKQWVGTHRQRTNQSGQGACALLNAAAALLHEIMHTCNSRGLFHAFRALSSVIGGGGYDGTGHEACDESYLAQNAFAWAMAKRFPCLLVSNSCSWMGQPCAWMNVNSWGYRRGSSQFVPPC